MCLIVILEQVQDVKFLPSFRLVSRQFDALVSPMMYHQVRLNLNIVEKFCLPINYWTLAQLQMSAHTRDVVVNRRLSLPLVENMLMSLERLENLRKWFFPFLREHFFMDLC